MVTYTLHIIFIIFTFTILALAVLIPTVFLRLHHIALSAYLPSRSSTMPRDKSFAWKEFKDIPSEGLKGQRVECRHCGHQIIGQAPKLENHLHRYDSYTRSLSTRFQHHQPTSGPVDSHTHRCGPVEQARLNKLLGLAIVAGSFAFGVFDKWQNPDMYEFIHALNTAYSVPERHIVAEKLLPECYTDVESQVKNLLTDCQWLNFTTGESNDKARRRIANLSVNIPTNVSLFLCNYHTGASNQLLRV